MNIKEETLESDIKSGKVWDDFCDALKSAGVLISGQELQEPLDKAEGYRYLTRLLRLALDMSLEKSDPYFPEFYSLSHETAKIGADNPDNLYQNASIDGSLHYRVWGNKGTVHYLSFGTKANRYAQDGTMATTGELESSDMACDEDGNFEIFLSQEKEQLNWLPMESDSNMLIVRQTFLDKTLEHPASVNIECLDAESSPLPLTNENLTKGLEQAVSFIKGTASTFINWANLFKENPNKFMSLDQSMFQRAGGDPNIFYLHGYWSLQEEQGLLIKTDIPECEYWNFQLNNFWMESLDYRYFDICVNNGNAKLETDGSLVILIASSNPGVKNWIDTSHHLSGTMLLRWVNAISHPLPETQVIQLKDYLSE